MLFSFFFADVYYWVSRERGGEAPPLLWFRAETQQWIGISSLFHLDDEKTRDLRQDGGIDDRLRPLSGLRGSPVGVCLMSDVYRKL